MAAAAPLRIGILDDLVEAAPPLTDTADWIRREVDEAIERGRLDREVELVHAYGLGLPHGTAAAVERAYAELDEQDVLLIVGPAIGDNALVATPLAERRRIPTIHWAGAERARGDYMFHLQVGSHEDEAVVLVRHLAATGIERVAVLYDRSPIGQRQLQYLQRECDVAGLQMAVSVGVSPVSEDATAEVRRVVEAASDAVVYVGLGLTLAPIAIALTAAGWERPRLAGSAGIRGNDPTIGAALDGWTYTDMYADDNETLSALLRSPAGESAHPFSAAKGHDLARLVVEGLARAELQTRDGVREGLELAKWLPAAQGHEGTTLGFGRYDRGALHGRYLVLRRWQGGRSVQVGSTG
jgi:ABC-type branched-subunit amino acid transport system substrate-binding protein